MANFTGYPEPGNIYDNVRAAQAQRNYNDMGETRVAARDNRYPDPGIIETLYNTLANIFRNNQTSQAAPSQKMSPIATYDTFQKYTDDYGDPLYSKVEPLILNLRDEEYYPQDDLSPNTYFLPRR